MVVRKEGVRGVAWNSRVVRRIPCMYVDACTYLRRGEECCVFSLETHLVDRVYCLLGQGYILGLTSLL